MLQCKQATSLLQKAQAMFLWVKSQYEIANDRMRVADSTLYTMCWGESALMGLYG
ncbi:MAG: hypothetical protein ACR5LD_02085 [Symbiopectobacterium sp.]